MNHKEKLLLILIIAIGFLLRTYNLNWDQNFHLHPDERFLTMVGNAIRLPPTLSDYLNPEVSTFNPANVGFEFFVYGLFPISLNKIIALLLGTDTYNLLTLQGRFLSAAADIIVVILIFKTLVLLEKKYKLPSQVKFLAALTYSVSVLPIQLSHFATVDTFLNLFVFASVFSALNYQIKRSRFFIIIAGILFGLALASKISAIFALPLILVLFIDASKILSKANLVKFLLNVTIFLVTFFLTLKFSYPYFFSSSFIFDPNINSHVVENLKTLKFLSSENSTFPPNVQWINKPKLIFPLINLAIFGIGIPLFLFFLLGLLKSLQTRANVIFASMIIWIFSFFIYQGLQITMTARYFLMIYPFIAIFAGLGLYELFHQKNKAIVLLIFALVFVWPIAFFSIYTKPHTRVAASEWINKNIPQGKVLLSEHWDDALPLVGYSNYKIIQLPVFDPDTDEKWEKMTDALEKGDYYILSSNRGWGSISSIPGRYPKMAKFYQDLLNGKLEYKKVKEFNSYPSLEYLRIPIAFPDDWAEENFTVFDHPRVLIFKKIK